MLVWRLLVSAILIPLFVGCFYLDARLGPAAPIFLAIVVILAICGAREMVDLLWTRSFTPNRTIVSACCVLVAAAAWWGRFGHMPIKIPSDDNTLAQVMLAYAMTILVLFLLATYRYREPGASMETLGAELLIVSYIGVLLGVVAQLRWVAGGEAGYLVIGSLLIVTKGGDVESGPRFRWSTRPDGQCSLCRTSGVRALESAAIGHLVAARFGLIDQKIHHPNRMPLAFRIGHIGHLHLEYMISRWNFGG
jgi:hypothetical protein